MNGMPHQIKKEDYGKKREACERNIGKHRVFSPFNKKRLRTNLASQGLAFLGFQAIIFYQGSGMNNDEYNQYPFTTFKLRYPKVEIQ